jgi:hypothetical protein
LILMSGAESDEMAAEEFKTFNVGIWGMCTVILEDTLLSRLSLLTPSQYHNTRLR